MSKIVVYYSFSGSTRNLAEDIALILDCEILEIRPKIPYSFSHNTAVREVREEIERGYCPILEPFSLDISIYDTIILCTPNWLKTYPPPVLSFFRNNDLKEKEIVIFSTHGGGGFGKIIEEVKKGM